MNDSKSPDKPHYRKPTKKPTEPATVDQLENQILLYAPELLKRLIKAGLYGKGWFGSKRVLDEKDKRDGVVLVTIEKQLDIGRWLLDKVWKSEKKEPGDIEKSQEQLMEDLGLNAETEPTES